MSAGCNSNSPEAIYGDYVLRVDTVDQDPLLAQMAPHRQAIVETLADSMASTTIYSFGEEGCARTILGHRAPYPCTYRRTEKSGTVVFRSEDRLGHPHFIRLTPTDDGLLMDTGQRTVTLKTYDAERRR